MKKQNDREIGGFFEEKACEYRRDGHAGLPQEAVTYKKQKQISRVALFYLSLHKLPLSTPCRFDVVAICKDEVCWIPNAFFFVK